jgi:hypothetical protein
MPFNPPQLLGEYETPRFSSGDVVECARRGDVRIVGLSSATIPWLRRREPLSAQGREMLLLSSAKSAGLS